MRFNMTFDDRVRAINICVQYHLIKTKIEKIRDTFTFRKNNSKDLILNLNYIFEEKLKELSLINLGGITGTEIRYSKDIALKFNSTIRKMLLSYIDCVRKILSLELSYNFIEKKYKSKTYIELNDTVTKMFSEFKNEFT